MAGRCLASKKTLWHSRRLYDVSRSKRLDATPWSVPGPCPFHIPQKSVSYFCVLLTDPDLRVRLLLRAPAALAFPAVLEPHRDARLEPESQGAFARTPQA